MVRKSAPASSRCVAKQWRSVCGWTRFFKPARWAACLTAWKTLLALIGTSVVSTASTGEEVGFGPETRPQPIFAKLFEQPWAKHDSRDPDCPCLGGCESACGRCRHHSLSTAPVLRVVARSRTASAARRVQRVVGGLDQPLDLLPAQDVGQPN